MGVFIARGLLNGNSWAFVLAGRNVARAGPGIPMVASNRAMARFWRAGDTNAPRGVRAPSNALQSHFTHCPPFIPLSCHFGAIVCRCRLEI